MKGKGKICRIDDWDKPETVKCKSWSHQERLCDLKEKVSLHKKGDIYYISQFARSKTGTSFSETNSRRNSHHSLQRERVSFSTVLL